MPSRDSFPQTIEVGGGPSVEVYSQREADAFMAAARANGRAFLSQRIADECWVHVVHLVNDDLERPDAPLGTCGPFESQEQAKAFADEWNARLVHPAVRMVAARLPSPAYFAEWIVQTEAFDLSAAVQEEGETA